MSDKTTLKSFTASQLQSKIGLIQDEVMQDKIVHIKCRNRPDMYLVKEEYFKEVTDLLATQLEKVRQLTELVKVKSGDSHLQEDLLK